MEKGTRTYYSTHCVKGRDEACAVGASGQGVGASGVAIKGATDLYASRYNRYYLDNGLGKYIAVNQQVYHLDIHWGSMVTHSHEFGFPSYYGEGKQHPIRCNHLRHGVSGCVYECMLWV
jgi:hypothetical protein